METLRFVDLFAGLGGFHHALGGLGHQCVFASEIQPDLLELYRQNFPNADRAVGDIRKHADEVPPHDVLCAGFPCQPFSKSGFQHGRRETRGTLFHEIIRVLERRRPSYVILENVGNFEVHAKGNTWRIVRESLERLGYAVQGTTHVSTGGPGLVSPHHLGFPHHRERFFVVASAAPLPPSPFPPREPKRLTSLSKVVEPVDTLSVADAKETSLSDQQVRCIEHWNHFLRALPDDFDMPGFPIWGDELWENYPFDKRTPFSSTVAALRKHMGASRVPRYSRKENVVASLPSYARSPAKHFPSWKIEFIRKNRNWLGRARSHLPKEWISSLHAFPPSLRKLEWNCKEEKRNLWTKVLQFRPSGLRAKRYTSIPALVAMTATQIPILGPERRFLTRREGLILQGFPEDHKLPAARTETFKALGNAVHVAVVQDICQRLVRPQLLGRNGSNGHKPHPAGAERKVVQIAAKRGASS